MNYDLQNFVRNVQKAVCLEEEQDLMPLVLVEQKIVLHYHHFLRHEVAPLITFLDHLGFLHHCLIERHLTSVLVGVWTWPYYAPYLLIRMTILCAVDIYVIAFLLNLFDLRLLVKVYFVMFDLAQVQAV